jgi:hypothetical protein
MGEFCIAFSATLAPSEHVDSVRFMWFLPLPNGTNILHTSCTCAAHLNCMCAAREFFNMQIRLVAHVSIMLAEIAHVSIVSRNCSCEHYVSKNCSCEQILLT